jgi:DNA polymerase-4
MAEAGWPRIVAHADMDAFYAAVEQLDDPSLRGKPVLVGPPSRRGVVLTASYEARPYKVGSAMPMALALQRCPQAIVVPPRFERYTEISRRVMRVFGTFSPNVEPLSLDEAFIDLSGSAHLFGTPTQVGQRIKDAVRAETGLAVSVGVSCTKFVAKVASGHRKPDGLTVVPPHAVLAWLAPMPVSNLWGVGAKTEQRLLGLGYVHIRDIANADPARLRRELGNLGAHLQALARGEDPRPVLRREVAHSMGSDRTLEQDVLATADIRAHLRRSADRLGRRLREKRILAGGVRVKLKTSRFQLLTRQCRLVRPTDVADELFNAATPLADALTARGPFRLVGLAVYDLQREATRAQLDLFGDHARQRVLEQTLDAVATRFGSGSMKRARDIGRHGTVMGDAPTLDGVEGADAAPGDARDRGDADEWFEGEGDGWD